MKFSIENLKATTLNALSDEDLIHEVALGKLVVDEMVANRLGDVYKFGLIRKDCTRLENVIKRIHQLSNEYAKVEAMEQFVELGILEHYSPYYSKESNVPHGTTKMRVEPNVLYYMQYCAAPRHGTAAGIIFEGLGLTTVKSNVMYYATPYNDIDVTNATLHMLYSGYTMVVKNEDDDIADYRLLTDTEMSELMIRLASKYTPDVIVEKLNAYSMNRDGDIGYFEDDGTTYIDSKVLFLAIKNTEYEQTIRNSMDHRDIVTGMTKIKNWA